MKTATKPTMKTTSRSRLVLDARFLAIFLLRDCVEEEYAVRLMVTEDEATRRFVTYPLQSPSFAVIPGGVA